mmetsp:Transcript_23333/g.30387  ORF Transcript_23333/g.30387 Transcript_23333/m.30387 type:complete len:247 (+) Transcript_23333:14-754(+)
MSDTKNKNMPDTEEDIDVKAGTWGGGESIAEQTEMWGDRASRALLSLNGKSTGNTGYENELLKKQRLKDQRAEESRISSLKFETISHGKSRASKRRKKKNNVQVEETDKFRIHLEDFYKKYAPDKLDSIPNLLLKFKGNEEALFELLDSKYITKNDLKDKPKKHQLKKAVISTSEEEGLIHETNNGSNNEEIDRSNKKKKTKRTKNLDNKDETEYVTGGMEDLNALNTQNINFFLSEVRNNKKPRK